MEFQRQDIARKVESDRLDLLADNLAFARAQLPFWAGIILVAASGVLPSISPGLTVASVAWAVSQFALGAAFHLACIRWPKGHERGWGGVSRRTAYIAIYLMVGVLWGLFPLALGQPGLIANQAVIAVVVAAVAAMFCSRLAPYPPVLIAAAAPLMLLGVPALFLYDNEIAILFAICGPAWFIILIVSSLSLSRRIGRMIETQYENQMLNERLVAACVEAQTASRAKSEFLANMSHELRTPLNAILGFSEIMRDELLGALSARYRDYAADIHGSGAHLLALINDLLDISKIEAGRIQIAPEEIDVRDALEQAARFVAPRAAEMGQTVSLALDAAPPGVRADVRAFRQIVLNLAGNAVKFTQAGGAIEIGLRAEGADAVLWVADNGPGIPKDRLATIFHPFERVDNAYSRASEGAGLGLALVQALAGLHGGAASIESDLGAGVKVTVRLPGAVIARPALVLAA